ncbi:MAG: hypothetical protein AB1491_00290 [Thermodesulfobacteriota bacterium]
MIRLLRFLARLVVWSAATLVAGVVGLLGLACRVLEKLLAEMDELLLWL